MGEFKPANFASSRDDLSTWPSLALVVVISSLFKNRTPPIVLSYENARKVDICKWNTGEEIFAAYTLSGDDNCKLTPYFDDKRWRNRLTDNAWGTGDRHPLGLYLRSLCCRIISSVCNRCPIWKD